MSEAIEKKEQLPYLLMDKLDDDLIKQELEGKLPTVLTYHFKDKGQEIWGLSKAGVDECKNSLAKRGEVIREIECSYTEDKDEFRFTSKAARFAISKEGQEIMLDTAIGFKCQSKYFAQNIKNKFAFEQGGIKSLRNACRRLIPMEIQQAIIEYARKEGKVKEVKENNIVDPIVECKKLYEQLNEKDQKDFKAIHKKDFWEMDKEELRNCYRVMNKQIKGYFEEKD